MKRNLIYYFLGLSLMLMVLDYYGLLKWVKGPVDSIVKPAKLEIWQIKSRVSNMTDVIRNYPQFKKILEESEKSKKENGEMKLQLSLVKDENTKLRMQLESPLPASFKFIPAEVLTVGSDMEVAAGEKDGVKEGMTVVDGTVLIGKVSVVSASRSRVWLPISREMQISAKTTRGANGVVVGGSSKSITLEQVLQKDPLFLDDVLVTSGMDLFPPNLLIGRIVYVSSDEAQVYKKAKVEPPIEYSHEKWVFIISSL